MLYLGLSLRWDKWLSTSDTLKQPFINAEASSTDQQPGKNKQIYRNSHSCPQKAGNMGLYEAEITFINALHLSDMWQCLQGLVKDCTLQIVGYDCIISLERTDAVPGCLRGRLFTVRYVIFSESLMIFLSGDSFGLCGCVERVSQHDSFIMKGRD